MIFSVNISHEVVEMNLEARKALNFITSGKSAMFDA
jgi:hypothetical protein